MMMFGGRENPSAPTVKHRGGCLMLTSLDEGATTGPRMKSWTRTFSQNPEDLWWNQHDKDQDTKK